MQGFSIHSVVEAQQGVRSSQQEASDSDDTADIYKHWSLLKLIRYISNRLVTGKSLASYWLISLHTSFLAFLLENRLVLESTAQPD